MVQGECDLLHFLVSSQHAQHGDGHFRKPVGGSHQGGDQVMMTMMMVMEALTDFYRKKNAKMMNQEVFPSANPESESVGISIKLFATKY